MPTTLNFNTKECNECGIIIPFNNVILDRQKDYSVTFTAVSSLPNCTTAVEPQSILLYPLKHLLHYIPL